jgi:hypothetical protein
VVSKPLLTTAEVCIWLLPVRNNPGHITAAPGALPREYQHAGVNFGGDFGDPSQTPAAGAPNCVEYLDLSISRYSTPDIFGFGCKSILCLKHSSFDPIFPANKAFTYFTMEKVGSYYILSTIRIGVHFRGRGRLNIPNGIASCAELSLHIFQ